MAHSMHFNGVDLSGSSYGLTVLSGPVPFLPGSKTETRKLGTRPGGYSQGGLLDAKEIPVVCHIAGTSNSNLKLKIDALRALLDPANGEKTLRFDHESDRYYLARLAGESEFNYIGPSAMQFELRFQCADPHAFSTTETTQVLAIESNPDTFNAPATGVIAGTTYARPVWKVKNTTGGAVSVITLQNTTTGETITCTYTVPNNDWIRFDSQRERLQYSPDDTEWFDIMGYLSTSNKLFPRLKAGVANALAVVGLSAGELTVVYRARYL